MITEVLLRAEFPHALSIYFFTLHIFCFFFFHSIRVFDAGPSDVPTGISVMLTKAGNPSCLLFLPSSLAPLCAHALGFPFWSTVTRPHAYYLNFLLD